MSNLKPVAYILNKLKQIPLIVSVVIEIIGAQIKLLIVEREKALSSIVPGIYKIANSSIDAIKKVVHIMITYQCNPILEIMNY